VRRHRRDILAVLLLVGAAAGLMPGCSSFRNPWTYNAPPSRGEVRASAEVDPWAKRIIVLGPFENPTRSPLRWRDIGPGMSDALASTLVKQSDFLVLSNPQLSRAVRSIIDGPLEQRSARLEELRRQWPHVRYVVTGQVTDFYHTADMPKETQRWGLFSRRREAFVAIRLNVIDVEDGRVVASDHVCGVASASNTPTKELYANLAFGSYVFWNTPLGRASEEAVGLAADMLQRAVPRADAFIRIVKQIGPRKITLSSGEKEALIRGQVYYVCLHDPATGRLQPILDTDTALPLRARIDDGRSGSSTAWLLGLKPLETDLQGAVLCRDLPSSGVTLADGATEAEASDSPPPDDR